MSLQFYQQLEAVVKRGRAVVVTVVRTQGSVPREVGAKLVIDSEGNLYGTIGGGAGEAKVIQQAQTVLATDCPQWVEIDLSGISQRTAEGVCGGTMQVWLQRWCEPWAVPLAVQICQELLAGRAGMLITPLVRFLSPYRLSVGSNAPALPTLTQLPSEDESIEALLEPLLPSPTLLIVGAGHVAAPLAQLANLAGFQIVVQDDRSEWMGAERFPSGTQLYPMAIAIALQRFRWPSQLYVVLVTRSYRHDVNALQALLLVSDHSRPCYIGAIGSNQRIRVVVDTLREAGIPLPLLQQIRAPIGLDIGAQTPEEIAVSICAELIQVRRGGTGQPLSQQRQVIPRLLQRKD